jgi:hypothetical protein
MTKVGSGVDTSVPTAGATNCLLARIQSLSGGKHIASIHSSRKQAQRCPAKMPAQMVNKVTPLRIW